jgi:ATP-dependent Clp protease ATP-binding subunit ClpB
VFNVLLQVLDDGRLTDNKGRTVNFKNTIVIMTSNIGSDLIRENFEKLTAQNREEVIHKTKNLVFDLLKDAVRPEFLNRIDEVIMFQPLDRDTVKTIVRQQLETLIKNLRKQDIQLHVTNEAVDYLSTEGFDPQFGARPVKRVIQKKVLNQLSKAILMGNLDPQVPVVVDAFDDELVFRAPLPGEELN